MVSRQRGSELAASRIATLLRLSGARGQSRTFEPWCARAPRAAPCRSSRSSAPSSRRRPSRATPSSTPRTPTACRACREPRVPRKSGERAPKVVEGLEVASAGPRAAPQVPPGRAERARVAREPEGAARVPVARQGVDSRADVRGRLGRGVGARARPGARRQGRGPAAGAERAHPADRRGRGPGRAGADARGQGGEGGLGRPRQDPAALIVGARSFRRLYF